MIRYRDFDDLLERMATRSPLQPALLSINSEGAIIQTTWDELQRLVCARAEALASDGRTCEALLADGTLECVVEVFSAVRAGVQIALLDPLMPNDVLAPLMHAIDADCVWAANKTRQAQLQQKLGPARAPAFGAHGMLFFTSGTTSFSKAGLLTDESRMASAFNGSSLMPLSADDVLLCLLPISHVFGFVCGLLWGLNCGATVALGRGTRYYADDLAAFSPTAVAVVPKLLEYLIARNALPQDLRLVRGGAADCPDELLDTVRERGIRTSLGYGLTETSSGGALSCGDDVHAMTICPDDEVAIAENGEILLKAPTCIMQGYYRDTPGPAASLHNGLLHTGARGYLDDAGLLHVQGRMKDVITLSGGTKLFLPEYEDALARALDEPDIIVALFEDKLTLICGTLAHERSDGELMKAIEPVMALYPPASRIADIARLGHALPRTATGDVERWKVREEMQHDDC